MTPVRSDNYHADIASSVFCGVLPGDGWSGRMEDSVLQGCIPVVIQVIGFSLFFCLHYYFSHDKQFKRVINSVASKLCHNQENLK